jgi:hypothetical protein
MWLTYQGELNIMNGTNSPARIATVAGLIAGAAGIAILKVSGVDMPAVPPGLIIMLVVAALMALTRWRWAPILGVVAALSEIAGFFASGSAPHLADPALGVLTGTWVRLLGVLTAALAGAVATLRLRRPNSR